MSCDRAIIVLVFLAIVNVFVPNAPPPSAKNIQSPVLGFAGSVAVTTLLDVSFVLHMFHQQVCTS